MAKKPLKQLTIVGLIREYKMYFLAYFAGIFIIIFSATYILGLAPEELEVVSTDASEVVGATFDINEYGYGQAVEEEEVITALPVKVSIKSVGVDVKVYEPANTTVAVLDEALRKGAVYYPGSGTFSDGNMLIFGHSTNWSVVNNQAYKAFNNLDKVTYGDEIEVTAEDGKTYLYAVRKVSLLNDDEALIEFDTNKKMLTLATCNTFGKKEERHVVEAEFIGIK